MDAIRALSYIEMMDRAAVKAVLSSCTAKSEVERMLFDQCFERFFIDPEKRKGYVEAEASIRETRRLEVIERATELQYQGQELAITPELQEIYSEISEEARNSILEYLNRSSTGKNMKPEFKPLMETVVKSKLQDLKKKQEFYRHTSVFDSPVSEAGLIAEDVEGAIREQDSLLYKNLSDIEDSDMPAVVRIIMNLSEKLRKNTRSRRRMGKRSELDFKGTIKASVSKGGALFKLKYKRKRSQRQKILTLCDVSASMYRFSGFVLKFIACLHSEISSTENFIFSTGVEKLNIRSFSTASNIEQEITKSRVWKKGTDASQALRYVSTDRFVILNSSTVIIIVSDAKTVFAARTAEELKLLSGKVKQVYWLNPIPEADWERIPGITGLRRNCVMLDCSNLNKLAKAVSML